MTDAVFCLWTLSVAAIGFTLGCSATCKMIAHRQAKADDLRAMIRVAILGHVGGSQ